MTIEAQEGQLQLAVENVLREVVYVWTGSTAITTVEKMVCPTASITVNVSWARLFRIKQPNMI